MNLSPYLFFLLFFLFSCNYNLGNDDSQAKKVIVSANSVEVEQLSLPWKKYNFVKTEVQQFPEHVEQSLVDYIALFPSYEKAHIEESLKELIQKSEVDEDFFSFLKDKFSFYLYHPNSPMRNDIYYGMVLKAYQDTKLISEGDKQRDQMLLLLINKNNVGDLASDFSFEDNSGKLKSMTSYVADLKLLLFYDPNCQHCKEMIAVLKESSVLNSLIDRKELIVLAIDPLGNLANWKGYKGYIPDNWVNGFNKSETIIRLQLYNIQAYPTMYLLDRDNKVILKDVDLYYLENFLTKK